MKQQLIFIVIALLATFSILHAQNVGVGTDNPQEFFSVGASSQFRVNASGNVVRINDIQYNFPASQGGTNTYLRNDGSGNLTWQSLSVTTGNISVTSGTANNTTFLRGDGAWASAGGAEQFPALVLSNNLSGGTTANVATPWLPLYNTTATSSGFYMVHVNLAVSSDAWGNVGNIHTRVSVGGTPQNGSYYSTYNPQNPTYFSSTFLLDIAVGQIINFEYAFEGFGGATTSWTGKVRFVKLSN